MKLSEKQQFELWGDGGPYSQVYLKIETRILDDSVSRVFVEVEASINPLTIKVMKQARKRFPDDIPLQKLLDHVRYMGRDHGYVVSAFSRQYTDESVMREAQLCVTYTKETVIKMHRYVMDLLELRKS